MSLDENQPATRRRRRTAADIVAAVHDAAIAEVAEAGIGGLTMEGIAERSGTAKTSLYRRWTTPQAILLDALYRLHPQEQASLLADDLRGDLLRALRQLVTWVQSPAARAAAAVLMERQHYGDLVDELYEKVFEARGGRFTLTVLRHYAEHGHIEPARVTPVVADIGEALVLKHVGDTGSPPDEERLEAIVDEAILPAVGASTP